MSRISIFTGHFGSRKTELALNYVMDLAKTGKKVALVDIDIVNPYFCSRNMKDKLEKTHYCPGCTHGVIHKLIAEVIDELEILDKTIAVAPVGCSVLMYNYFACDVFEAAHGRAPATATGIKRTNPYKVVFTCIRWYGF